MRGGHSCPPPLTLTSTFRASQSPECGAGAPARELRQEKKAMRGRQVGRRMAQTGRYGKSIAQEFTKARLSEAFVFGLNKPGRVPPQALPIKRHERRRLQPLRFASIPVNISSVRGVSSKTNARGLEAIRRCPHSNVAHFATLEWGHFGNLDRTTRRTV
jgi:hypothetical protein